MANWATVPALAKMETTVALAVCEDCSIMMTERTLTVYSGFVFDDDDGLPLSYPGEREHGNDQRYLYGSAWARVAEHKI